MKGTPGDGHPLSIGTLSLFTITSCFLDFDMTTSSEDRTEPIVSPASVQRMCQATEQLTGMVAACGVNSLRIQSEVVSHAVNGTMIPFAS